MKYEIQYSGGSNMVLEGSLSLVKRKATEKAPSGESIKVFSEGHFIASRRRSSAFTGEIVWAPWEMI